MKVAEVFLGGGWEWEYQDKVFCGTGVGERHNEM